MYVLCYRNIILMLDLTLKRNYDMMKTIRIMHPNEVNEIKEDS